MPKRSDAERKAWREKMNGLVKQVSNMSPEKREEIARKMPIVTCEGHPLSGFNACFLSMQSGRTLTIVAGFKQWGKADRRVCEGQHAAGYIYVPTNRKKDSGPDPDEKVRFRMVPVFDIYQTEPVKEMAGITGGRE